MELQASFDAHKGDSAITMMWLQHSLNVAAPPSLSKALTPRSGRWHLCPRPEPATGRPGAYPDKTLTCEKGASFRTHHIFSLSGGLSGGLHEPL